MSIVSTVKPLNKESLLIFFQFIINNYYKMLMAIYITIMFKHHQNANIFNPETSLKLLLNMLQTFESHAENPATPGVHSGSYIS